MKSLEKLINNRPLVWAAVSLIVGILAASFSAPWNLIIAGIYVLVLLGSLFFIEHPLKTILAHIAIILIGFTAFTLSDIRNVNYSTDWAKGATVTGRVCDLPGITQSGYSYLLDKVSVNGKAQPLKLELYERTTGFTMFKPGDILSFSAPVQLNIKAGKNASISMHADFLEDKSAYYARSNDVKKIGFQTFLIRPILEYKDYVLNQMIFANMSLENSQLESSLLFGSNLPISDELRNNFALAGVSHILSVSGMHVAFVVLLLTFLLRKLHVSPSVQFLISLLALIAYCALTAFCSPVLRSAVMALTFLYCNILGRKYDLASSLAFSVILILLIQPYILYDISFMLSATAMVGLVLLFKPIRALMGKGGSVIKDTVAMTISAQLGTAPIIAYYFHYLSVVSLISNIIIIPLSAIAVIGGVLCMFLQVISSALAATCIGALQYVCGLIAYAAEKFAQIPVASMKAYFYGYGSAVAYILLLFTLSPYLLAGTRKRVILSGTVATLTIVLSCLAL